MLYWGKRTYGPNEDYAQAKEMMAQLKTMLGNPHELMMLARFVPETGATHVFVGLPKQTMLAGFGGFAAMRSETELPDGLTVVARREDGFERNFPRIAAKLSKAK